MTAARVVVGVCAAGVLAAGAVIVKPWEGRELHPYRDIVGVATVCYGHTLRVEDRRYTPAECDKLLESDLARHWRSVSACIRKPITQPQSAAILSWAFNVGVGAACGSTLVRQINAGQPAAVWCKQLLRWNRAGGREVRGLTRRRQAEYLVCTGESA